MISGNLNLTLKKTIVKGDIGADVNVLPIKLYNSMFSSIEAQPAEIVRSGPGANRLKVEGVVISANLSVNRTPAVDNYFIVDSAKQTLFYVSVYK